MYIEFLQITVFDCSGFLHYSS